MRAIKVSLAACFAALMAAGCVPKTELVYVPTPAPIVHPQPPSPATIDNIEWQVWNKEAARNAAWSPDGDRVWYVLDADEFKKLLDALTGVAGYIEKQNNTITYYRSSIDTHNANVERAKAEAEQKTRSLKR